jgi:uncharacterized protein
MKFALLAFAVVVLVWLLSRATSRRAPPPQPGRPTSKSNEVKPMLACAKCGVLIPGDETLPGRGGVFCSAAHRDAFESSPPGT